MERHNGIEPDPEGAFVYYADAQATVAALRRELESANALLYKKNCAIGRAETALDAKRENLKQASLDLQAAWRREADLQTQLTQLQALVRAWGTAHEYVDDWFKRAATDENTPTISEFLDGFTGSSAMAGVIRGKQSEAERIADRCHKLAQQAQDEKGVGDGHSQANVQALPERGNGQRHAV